MHRDKIEAALSAALKNIGDSRRALSNKNDEKALSDSLWSASAETEYAVFLLSLTQVDKSESASWKHETSAKQSIEIEPALVSAQKLLESAKTKIETEDFEKGYEETWMGRNLLLKVQELLEKKRKEAKK